MSDLDFYAVLGVLPDAEEVVIAAAYRALAKRYHPDHRQGDPTTAHKRMWEINKAYEVLGDAVRRSDYDQKRTTVQLDFPTYDNPDQAEAFKSALSEADANWETACSIFPDLLDLRAELAQVSAQQAFAFVTVLLETKAFTRRAEIAAHLERVYLERYFGTNEHILDYAKHLARQGHKDAVKLLNHLVSVMGSDVDPVLLINRTENEFPHAERYSLETAIHAKIQAQTFISYQVGKLHGRKASA